MMESVIQATVRLKFEDWEDIEIALASDQNYYDVAIGLKCK